MKPLGHKSYGSIPHLPGSRVGPADHHCAEGQATICTKKVRDKHDRVWVTEKLDGANVGVANIDGKIFALGRAGYLANTSPYKQHHMFADWVEVNKKRFLSLLEPGTRCAGEWLAQAHGTRYNLKHEPFVIFDLFEGQLRCPWEIARGFIQRYGFVEPCLLNDGYKPLSIEDALKVAESLNAHGADEIEGAVWRVESKKKFDFMAKYVKPSKQDGYLLPEITGQAPVWNWTCT